MYVNIYTQIQYVKGFTPDELTYYLPKEEPTAIPSNNVDSSDLDGL